MKTIISFWKRYILAGILLVLWSNGLAQTNVLRINDVSYSAGRTATIPIELENQSDIVGVQFEIVTPYELKAFVDPETSESSLASLNRQRLSDFQASVNLMSGSHSYNSTLKIYYKRYRVILYSPANTPINGSSGTLLNLQLDLPETLENGQVLPVTFYEYKSSTTTSSHAEVILTDRSGTNVVSGFMDGSITVEVVPRPDLVPSSVAVSQTFASPGDDLDFSWVVSNEGDLATGAGWSERLFLENEQSHTRVYVGTSAYEGTLAADASVVRNFRVRLSDFPGVSGACRPVVQIVPSAECGEFSVDQTNNTAAAEAYSLNVRKFLVLTAYKNPIPENTANGYACELRRTGDFSLSQTFNVISRDRADNTGRLKINSDGSGVVRFGPNMSKLVFNVYPIGNETFDIDPRVAIVVNEDLNNGYNCVIDSVSIEEDDLVPLTLTLDKTEYNEGEVIHVTASVPEHYYPGDLYVYLTIEQTDRFKMPQRIVIPEGETSGTVNIQIVQDNKPMNDGSVKIIASAEHHQKYEKLFILHDDDMPAISMTLSPTAISEAAGPKAIIGTISRTGVTNNKIDIRFSDDGDGDIYYTRTLTMPAGTTSMTFPIGVYDNQLTDGDRTVNVMASVYLSDCNCSAAGDEQTSVTVPVTITDNDGPALSVTTSKTTIIEGDESGCEITVTRNTSTAQALSVTLSTEAADVVFPSNVTIPAGQESVTVPFRASSNDTTEGDRTITVTASATDFSSGAAWLLISDRTLPDAVITDISLEKASILAGEKVLLTMQIANYGAGALPANTEIQILKSGKSLTNITLGKSLLPGEVTTEEVLIDGTTVPGNFAITATANYNRKNAELLYLNNTSAEVPLQILSLYSFTINTDKALYNEGETVTFSGEVSSNTGANVKALPVEPYLIFNGLRIELSAQTDNEGHFAIEYELPAGYRGHFQYGACNPLEGKEVTTGTFDVYGFERVSSDYIKNQVFKDEPYESTIDIRNLTNQTLHNVRVESFSGATDRYDIEMSPLATIGGKSTASLSYRLLPLVVSEGSEWDKIFINLTCDEGAKLQITLYNYTRLHYANIKPDVTIINTTVTKGTVRTYPVQVVNTGMTATGKVVVDLPKGLSDFISLATPAEMPSMEPGDTTTVMLRFNPGDLDVNVIQKGSIAVNSENGNGFNVWFNVKVVSEAKGSLRVRVQDEITVYGNKDGEKPYVEDATVQLRDYNTGLLVASGKTTQDGILFEEVNEGYYQLYVTAEKHDSYHGNVLISPGETTEHLATVFYQAVSVQWDVVETSVEDEYQIVSTVVYETQVPKPIVRVTAPQVVPFYDLDYGHSTMFNVVLRNDGFIAAQDVEFNMDELEGFTFTPLVQNQGFTLGAEQSYIIPFRVTRNPLEAGVKAYGPRRKSDDNDERENKPKCSVPGEGSFNFPCGAFSNTMALGVAIASGLSCGNDDGGGGDLDVKFDGVGGRDGGDGGGTIPTHGYGSRGDADGGKELCKILNNCLPSDLPFSDCGAIVKNGINVINALGCAGDVLSGKASLAAQAAKCALGVAFGAKRKAPRRGDTVPALLQSYGIKASLYLDYLTTINDYVDEHTGVDSLGWQMTPELTEAIQLIDGRLEDEYNQGTLYDWEPSELAAAVISYMPNSRSNCLGLELEQYIERRQNSYRIQDGMEPTSENHDHQDIYDAINNRVEDCKLRLIEMGFVDWKELVMSANNDKLEFFSGKSENVCAHVKLEIEQKLVLTRQAFRGTLIIDNSTSDDLENIDFRVTVTDLLGQQATSHEFQINFESIEGFEGSLDGPWTLAPKTKGKVNILFIPTKYAAPDTLTTYAFGGTLYLDMDGRTTVRMLTPVSLQVKPSPVLDLTYFMQRDIYGDNPLTLEVVEPIIPAEFSVLINNKGNGDASNVRMITRQPQIVENEKGLLVDFAIVSSSLNGGEKVMALDSTIATHFGDIEAGKCSYATWDLTSTLLGHFIDYDVQATHVTSYGNPDLSLLDQVTIHELIHSVNAKLGDETYRAWVTNDVPDGHDEPDHIYLSNGTDEALKTLSNITSVTALGDNKWRLTVTVPQREWFYTSVADPSGGTAKIVSLIDEDTDEELDAQNFWTTQYVMQDGFDPLPSNKLHVVAYADAPKTFHFVVEFEPMPMCRLEVVEIDGVPSNQNDLAEEPIERLTVTFNKPIQPSTFTRDDIVLRYEGNKQDTALPITQDEDDEKVFYINTSSLTNNGYYVLQVKTDNIVDSEGFYGYYGKQAKWMLFKDGLLSYYVAAFPIGAGTTNVTEGEGTFGQTLNLTATPSPGYEFAYWGTTNDGTTIISESQMEVYSTEPELSIDLTNIVNLRAVFRSKPLSVRVLYEGEEGSVDVKSGLYDYGTVLHFDAEPVEGYGFLRYEVNGETVSNNPLYDHTVTEDATITPVFRSLSPVGVILRDDVDYVPEYVELADVKLMRSFRKGTWNTIVLPCPVEDPDAVFGTGTQVARLNGFMDNTMKFDLVDEMEANIPYLIKPGGINSSSLSNGQTKTSVFDISGTVVEEPEGNVPMDEADEITFVGTYVSTMIPVADNNYYISSDILYFVDANAHVPSGRFRGYFHANRGGLAKRLAIDIDDVEDGFIDIMVPVTGDVYSIDGVLVRKAGAESPRLAPGLYIMNGQKVFVK